MAFPAVLLIGGLVAGAGYMLASGKRLPEGQNPFDDLPPGVDRNKRIAQEPVKASSGRSYKVSSFRCPDGRLYFVAEKVGDVDWISYFVTPGTGARQRWHANADKFSDIAEMVADFDMVGQEGAP